MKRNYLVRKLLLQAISNSPGDLLEELHKALNLHLQSLAEPVASDKEVKAALKYLQRNQYITSQQLQSQSGQFTSCSRKVLKIIP